MTKGTIYKKKIYQQCFLNVICASLSEVNFDVLIFVSTVWQNNGYFVKKMSQYLSIVYLCN